MTPMIPAPETFPALEASARRLAQAWRLPLRQRAWQGGAGQWRGRGTGSSIDFQDHRAYLPGDDPRYIDWQAYARSGHYTMKLYHEEVSPAIDLVLDISPSMFVTPAKAARTVELFYFAYTAALIVRGHLRTWLLLHGDVIAQPPDTFQNPSLFHRALTGSAATTPAALSSPTHPSLDRLPWRRSSLRVWISDLLFEGPPSLHSLSANRGRGVVLAPFTPEESQPIWDGNLELIDCESGGRRRQRVDAALMERYRLAYQRHFELWRDAARRAGVALAQVDASLPLDTALGQEALPKGAVEVA